MLWVKFATFHMQHKQMHIMKLDEIEAFKGRHSHVAVHFEHYILVFSGRDLDSDQLCSNHKIWMYNLHTEQWRPCELSGREIVPSPAVGACAVRVGQFVYTFGGLMCMA